MSSVLAIVSKAVFEKQARDAGVGAVLALDAYGSTHATLASLADGGALFLVTVRPPDEQLWLVAVLEKPKLGKAGWSAAANKLPITDISKLKAKLKFTTGTGIQAKPGALGMSLQTPRGLTDADVALLRSATGKLGKDSRVVAPAKVELVKKKATKQSAVLEAPPAAPVADGGAHLAALQAAFAAKDGAAVLTAALAWWRAQRSPVLAELIAQISDQVSGAPVASQIEFAKVAAAKDPLDLGRLLPAVTGVQVNFLPTVSQLLAKFPDDPRIATAFATWTVKPITTSISKTGFWTQMHETVERIGDVRLIKPLQKRLAGKRYTSEWWDRFIRRIERTIARLQKAPAAAPVDAKSLANLNVGKLAPIRAAKTIATAPATPAAPQLSGPLLAQAATHLAAGRTVAAIDAMVERWRETRVPALADLIDRATRLLPTYDLPLSGDAAWMAVCQSEPSLHMPQLLTSIGSDIRIAMIAGLPDDPRISLRLAERCEAYVGRNDMGYAKTHFETLARHRDVRSCAPLCAAYGDFVDTYLYAARPAKRYMSKFALHPETFFPTWPLVLDDADQKLFDKLDTQVTAALTKAFARERELIAAIAADWKSDGPREVYADWLMEREHPRGELIMLEMRPKRTAEESARLAELQAIHGLFGGLDHLIDHESSRDRGLYRAAKVHYQRNTLSWRAAAACPLAALLESVEITGEHVPTSEDFLAFVAAAPSLRKVKGMSRGWIEMLDPDHAKHWKVVGTGQSQHVVRL